MSSLHRVAGAAGIAPGQCRTVAAAGRLIALCNVDGAFFAIDNTCAHRGGPLGEGYLEGNVVTCPWHGWSFDVTSGVCPVNPNVAVARYEVAVEGDDVLIAV